MSLMGQVSDVSLGCLIKLINSGLEKEGVGGVRERERERQREGMRERERGGVRQIEREREKQTKREREGNRK